MLLAYPTPGEYLYSLLRDLTVRDLRDRFTRWNFTARETRALLGLKLLAQLHDFEHFAKHLSEAVRLTPEDYPPVLRPRQPTRDLEEKRLRYGALLKGKRVVLVGPSQSIVGSRRGKELEAYDLVVRVNFQWPVPPRLVADIGKRMDILYHCCNGDVPIERLFRRGFDHTRFVCWQFGIESHKLQHHCVKVGVPELEVSSVFEELLPRMKAFPTTGTAALCDLLSYDIERLYVTGMTFFHDPHYGGYPTGGSQSSGEYRRGRSEAVGIHDVSAQFELVRSIQASDLRLSVDPTLGELLAIHAGSSAINPARR